MTDLYNKFGIVIISIFLFSHNFASPVELICQQNDRRNNISCKNGLYDSRVITEMYIVDNCNSTNLNNTSCINKLCIGQNRCNISNCAEDKFAKYQCTDNDKIYNKEKGQLTSLTINSPFYFTASDSLIYVPLLPIVPTIARCNFINKYKPILTIGIIIGVLVFETMYQTLEIFVENNGMYLSFKYSNSSTFIPNSLVFDLKQNASITILYKSDYGYSSQHYAGRLLVGFSWLSESQLLATCEPITHQETQSTTSTLTTTLKVYIPTLITNDSRNYTAYNSPGLNTNLSNEEIAGIIIGAIVLIAILIITCLVIFFRRKGLKQRQLSKTNVNNLPTSIRVQEKEVNLEYNEYEPSPIHLEGSDVSGSFVFEKKGESIEPKNNSKPTKKIPKLIKSNSNTVVSYSTVNSTFKNRPPNVANPSSNVNNNSLVISKIDEHPYYELSNNNVTLEENNLYSTLSLNKNNAFSIDSKMELTLEENDIYRKENNFICDSKRHDSCVGKNDAQIYDEISVDFLSSNDPKNGSTSVENHLYHILENVNPEINSDV